VIWGHEFVELEPTEGGYAAVCSCTWRSTAHQDGWEASRAWHAHQSGGTDGATGRG
jgi:hypothetical protein